jgi:hypothetical protein
VEAADAFTPTLAAGSTNSENPFMGKLLYSSTMEIDIDDRPLAHLHIIISERLRNKERFFFSWKDSVHAGGGRSSIWLDPTIPLLFSFSSSQPVPINRRWLEALAATADASSGLTFLPEPDSSVPTALPRSRV